jgi:hypothetical protein
LLPAGQLTAKQVLRQPTQNPQALFTPQPSAVLTRLPPAGKLTETQVLLQLTQQLCSLFCTN